MKPEIKGLITSLFLSNMPKIAIQHRCWTFPVRAAVHRLCDVGLAPFCKLIARTTRPLLCPVAVADQRELLDYHRPWIGTTQREEKTWTVRQGYFLKVPELCNSKGVCPVKTCTHFWVTEMNRHRCRSTTRFGSLSRAPTFGHVSW